MMRIINLKNYSIASDLINLTLFIFVGLVIGHLFNQFLYGLIFSLSIFIIYVLYTNYIFEKWLYNFRINKLSAYHQKHQILSHLKVNHLIQKEYSSGKIISIRKKI